MITRDFLLRELQQFIQILAVVLFHKKQHAPEAAQDALAEGVRTITSLPLETLRAMDRDAVRDLAAYDGLFEAERAVALADLLAEDAHPDGRLRAAWLYEMAVEAGGPYPFDVHERITALRAG